MQVSIELHCFKRLFMPLFLAGSMAISMQVQSFVDTDLDGIPDDWELHFGLNEQDASDAYTDLDGDGFANDTEFLRGGNPLVADAGRLPDYVVYWDGLLNEWWDQSPNSSWVTHNRLSGDDLAAVEADMHSTAEVHSGLYSLAMVPDRWRFLNLLHNNIDMSFYETLEFYIHGGDVGKQNIKVSLLGSTYGGTPQYAAVYVDDYIDGGSIAAGEWRKVSIPLATLLPTSQVVSRVNIGWPNTGVQNLYYLDDIKFKAPVTTPALVIDIDANEQLHTFGEELLGSNGAYWVTNMNDDTLIERTVHAGITMMRYPGGNSADEFHWQDWNDASVSDWITTPDDYIEYLTASATKGVFTANFGTGTAQEAVDFLNYVSAAGADIPVWEIGNEIYGSWQNTWTRDGAKYMNGNSAHDGAKDYCAQLKAADPSVKVAMSGPKTPTQFGRFATKAVNHANDCFDYYSFHYYSQLPGQLDYHGLMASPMADIPLVAENLKALLASKPDTANVQLAMTEYNSYSSEPEIVAKHTANMLFLADMIGQAAMNDIAMANHWFIGGIPNGSTGEFYGALIDYLDYRRQPSYYVFPLWTKMGEQMIAVDHPLDAAAELSTYASLDSDTGNLTLLVINKTGQTQAAQINVDNFNYAEIGYAFEAEGAALNADDVSYNGLFNPTGMLALVPPLTFSTTGSAIDYSFSPYSLTLLRLEPAAP